MAELTAVIKDSSPNVHCILEDGAKRRSYTVTLESFIDSLERSSGARASFTLGEMPAGYINGYVAHLSNDAFTGGIVLRVPASVRMIAYYNESFVVPVPELVFRLTFNKGKLSSSYVAVLDKDGKLCRYPYTNVYDDCHICWGSAAIPVVKSLKETESIPELFLRFPCNGDLARKEILQKANVPTVGELFKKLEGKNKFPSGLLLPLGTTYEEFIKL